MMVLSGCKNDGQGESAIELPQPEGRSGNDIGTSGYTTSVGDALDIFVLEDTSFNGSYIVRPSGDLIIPKAGRIQVINMTLSQVEAVIKKSLETNQLKQATVIADPIRRGAGSGEGTVAAGLTIYITGNVAKTGRVLVPFVGGSQITAYQAVMDAGGFTAFAHKKKSYVIRRDVQGRTRKLPVNFEDIENSRSIDLPLQDGDTLVVPQKLIGL